MKDYDYLLPLPVLVLLFIKMLTRGDLLVGMAAFLCQAVIWLGFCALVLRWPKRYRQYKWSQTLLAQPHQKIIGQVSFFQRHNTGKTKRTSVSDGSTMEIGGDWSYYVHSHTESSPVYDGYEFLLSVEAPEWSLKKFRVKPPFFEIDQQSEKYMFGLKEVTYVTDTDGTNFCLSFRPMDEEQGSSFPM